ncbi:NADPH2:quinone reductase [Edaphobacter aggregans]|uniref:NADPH2:quinone reductase n=2 Tax=Edaphobacter aggregans TaxID=570835 RepID=A0A3R9QAU6_9BACT|nr:NADPH2:quinone reductase [Edaphobacter aggregans]
MTVSYQGIGASEKIRAMKALVFDSFGDADVLRYREIDEPVLGVGQALIRMKAIGLNFADIYRRRGNYHLVGDPPYVLGYEGAGVVVAINADDTRYKVGDRVAFADSPHANAEYVAVPLDHLIRLPDDISFESASAVLLQGLTAQYLLRDSHRLVKGESVLVHAAAGGVGLYLTQLAKSEGAFVVGLVSTELKRRAVLEAGADLVLLSGSDWVDVGRAATPGGLGFDVVYDSVGITLRDSLRVARMGGHVVFYGMSGGDPAPVDPRLLMDESKSLTGGDLWNVLTSAEERIARSNALFAMISAGKLRVQVAKSFALSDGAEAHRLLESRQVIGKVLLIPG